MSTTSRKRVHGLASDDKLDGVTELKSVRKTRSQKENCEILLTEKKRKNYVRYPSQEDDTLSLNGNGETKTVRKSRRNTLKEQNLLITDSETSNDERKPVRLTRRTKKLDTEDCSKNDPPIEENNEVIVKSKKGKKKKTKKTSIGQDNIEVKSKLESSSATKKKSNKRKTKKKSNFIVPGDVCTESNKSLNKSSASIDSSHIADSSSGKNEGNNCNILANADISAGVKKQNASALEIRQSCENLEKSSKQKTSKTKVENSEIPTKSCLLNKKRKDFINETEQFYRQSEIEKEHDTISINDNTFETITNKKSSVGATNTNINDISSTSLHTSFEMKIVPSKTSSAKKRKSLIVDRNSLTVTNLDAMYEKNNTNEMNKSNQKNSSSSNLNSSSSKKKHKSSIKNSTYDKIDDVSSIVLDSTYEIKQSNSSQENCNDKSCKLSQDNIPSTVLDSTYEKEQPISSQENYKGLRLSEEKAGLNSTYDKKTNNITVCLDATFNKNDNMNQSFNNNSGKKSNSTDKPNNRRSSLISLDNTDSKSDLTDDYSHLSITSDESKEKIINITPVLIESSLDESGINEPTGKSSSPVTQTPLKREGTFNKDETATPLKTEGTYTDLKPTPVRENTFTSDKTPITQNNARKVSKQDEKVEIKKTPSEKVNLQENKIPLRREGTFTEDKDSIPEVNEKRLQSLPSPDHTPFPLSKSCSSKNIMNITRSIEKNPPLIEIPSRTTKVMFCSPVDNPTLVTQMKGKVIKSTLKGSKKSFVFDDNASEISRPARKRSYTQSEVDQVRSKRKRLTEDQQHSVERLVRPRSSSATVRLQDPGTPSKKTGTNSKTKDKVPRTRLPNFAALHQKQFEKMESLDECQERKAKRARKLLTPTAPINVMERTSPKENQPEQSKKAETPKKSESGYTRFGFKLNMNINPFSFPKNGNDIPANPKALKRQATLPSLAGTTNMRRILAKQTVLREKSFTEKRNVDRKESRTVIKGVRTNRRFELQMKMRNINEK